MGLQGAGQLWPPGCWEWLGAARSLPLCDEALWCLGLALQAIVTELEKLGVDVEEGRDFCVIQPPEAIRPNVAIDTYDDHRMAMCFALAACGGVPVTIKDPACTSKTFPDYFDKLDSVVSRG